MTDELLDRVRALGFAVSVHRANGGVAATERARRTQRNVNKLFFGATSDFTDEKARDDALMPS